MMKNRFAVLVVLALLSAACGGPGAEPTSADEQDTTEAAPPATEGPGEETTQENSQDSPAASTAGGTVMVDGESFDVSQLYRCEPYADPGKEPNPDDLDLAAAADGVGYLSVTVTNDESVDMSTGDTYPVQYHDLRLDAASSDGTVEYESVASNDQDGNWSFGDEDGTPLDGAPFTIDGDHISGGMTLVETYPEEGAATVDVSFDLEIPGDIIDCSTG